MELLHLESPTRSSRVEIVPGLGGMIRQIEMDFDGEAFPVLSADTDGELSANPLFRGRLLLPFNDRIPNGRYSFSGNEHQLVTNCVEDGSAIHGMLYDRPMTVVEHQQDQVTLRCKLDNCPGYPFDLDIRVDYKIERNRFSLVVQATNAGTNTAPFAFGWHPYFCLGGALKETTLTHGGGTYVAVDEELLPTGELCLVDGRPWDFRGGAKLNQEELDLAISAPDSGSCTLAHGGRVLTIQAEPEIFPYTQLFLPPDRKSIAVEPITAATDAFNRPELGLRKIAPGDSFRGEIVLISDMRC